MRGDGDSRPREAFDLSFAVPAFEPGEVDTRHVRSIAHGHPDRLVHVVEQVAGDLHVPCCGRAPFDLPVARETLGAFSAQAMEADDVLDVGVVPEDLRMLRRQVDAQLGTLRLHPFDDGGQHEVIPESVLGAKAEDARIVLRRPESIQEGEHRVDRRSREAHST